MQSSQSPVARKRHSSRSTARSSPQPKRRVPGPAGIEEACSFSKELSEMATQQQAVRIHSDRSKERRNASEFVSRDGNIQMNRIPLHDNSLWRAPWLSACIKYGVDISESHCKLFMVRKDSTFIFQNNIRSVKLRQSVDSVSKIDRMMVVLRQCRMDVDALGVVIDPFDSMSVTFSERTLKEYNAIRRGSVLVLQNVTIYQAEPRRYYLNVTERNIIEVIPHDMTIGELSPSLKVTLRSFYKKLGLKTAFESKQKKKVIEDRRKKKLMEQKAKESMNTTTTTTTTNLMERKGTKRRYSDMADDPWIHFCGGKEDAIKTKRKKKKMKMSDDGNGNGNHRENINGDNIRNNKVINIGDPEADDDDVVVEEMKTPNPKQRKQSKAPQTTVSKKSVQSAAGINSKNTQKEQLQRNEESENVNIMESQRLISESEIKRNESPSEKSTNSESNKEEQSSSKKQLFSFGRFKRNKAAQETKQNQSENRSKHVEERDDGKKPADFVPTQLKVIDTEMVEQIPDDINLFGDLFTQLSQKGAFGNY